MSYITVEEAKLHCRITHSSEDTLVQTYIDAAEQRVQQFLNRDLDELVESPGGLIAPVKVAALLYVGDMWENRESIVGGAVNEVPTAENLLWPYREGLGI